MDRTEINKDVCRLTTDREYTWHYRCGNGGVPWYKGKNSVLSWLIFPPSSWRLLDWGWCRCSSSLWSIPPWTVFNLMPLLTAPITSFTSHAILAPMLLLTSWACWYFTGSATSLTYGISLWGQWIPTRRSGTLSFWTLPSARIPF